MICIHIVYIYIYKYMLLDVLEQPSSRKLNADFLLTHITVLLNCNAKSNVNLGWLQDPGTSISDLRWKNIVVPAKIVCDIAVFMERVNSGNQVLVVCLIASDSAS